jgi:hypothetical protein
MKIKRIDFDLDRWKQGGCKLVFRDPNMDEKVRIVCTDVLPNNSILALVTFDNVEYSRTYYNNGKYYAYGNDDIDLQLEVPEYEDGDYVHFDKCDCIGILKNYAEGSCHVTLIGIDDTYLHYDENLHWTFKNMRLANEKEVNRIDDRLTKDGKKWNSEKKCIEDLKPKCELKCGEPVLVREFSSQTWVTDIFIDFRPDVYPKMPFIASTNRWKQCIPYNKETKDLLRTFDEAPAKYKTW